MPFGAVDFTSYALAMKSAGVDAAACSCVQSSNIAMAVAAKQAGIPLKAALMFSGADSSLFNNPTATAAAQGTYWPTTIVPLDLNNPATNTFIANLKKYDSSYKGGYPELRPDRLLSFLGSHDRRPHGRRSEPDPEVVHRQPDQGDELERRGPLSHDRRLRPLRDAGDDALRVLHQGSGEPVRHDQQRQAVLWDADPQLERQLIIGSPELALDRISAIEELRAWPDGPERMAVIGARMAHVTWAEIGVAIGTSRQGVWNRYRVIFDGGGWAHHLSEDGARTEGIIEVEDFPGDKPWPSRLEWPQ